MNSFSDLAGIRKNYALKELTQHSVNENPIIQFKIWLQEAIQAETPEPTAMVLATADKNGNPSARVVLLKGITEQGFVFYTNYLSHKGQDMAVNAAVALTFFWPQLERQVRIEGKANKTDPTDSDSYFYSRPVGSQIGAWASPQSKRVANRQELEEASLAFEQKFANLDRIPRPGHWGGYEVIPDLIEFWQGRPNRLHDRLVYTKKDLGWEINRLAP